MRRSRSGVTLMECLMSLVIILIGFFAIAKIFPNSQRASVVNRNQLTARRIAQNYISNIQSLPYTPSRATLAPFQSPQGDVTFDERVENSTTTVVYKPTISFETGNPGNLGQAADTVVVKISWRDPTGGPTDSMDTNKSITLRGGLTSAP